MTTHEEAQAFVTLSEAELEKRLTAEYVNTSTFAISPNNFRRGWRACIAWLASEGISVPAFGIINAPAKKDE